MRLKFLSPLLYLSPMLVQEFEQQGLSLFRWRSYWPLVGLALALWIVWLRPNPYPWLVWPALILGLLGLFIRIITVGFTPKNTSGRNTAEGQVAESINTQGMYSMVRHPLYLGNFLMWLAPAVLTGHLWFILVFCLAFWLYYERIMFAEEQFLQRKFGKPYQDWGSQRPAFIPKRLMWQRPDLQFSWKKSVKKEKNGLAALLLVLAGILYVEQVGIRRQLFWPELDFWTLSALASTLLYLVLKFIKKHTHWLDEEGR